MPLERRRRKLQQQAFLIAESFYGATPKEFTRQIKRCLKAWRKETKASPPQPL